MAYAWRKWVPGAMAAVAALLGGEVAAQPAVDARDTLRVAAPLLCPTRALPTSGSASPCVYTHWPMYETLVQINLQGEATPLLATEWRSVDRTHWQFKLRPNVKFHSGEPFAAQNLVDWFGFLGSPDGLRHPGGQNFQRQSQIVSARVVDPMTIEVETKVPNSLIPRLASVYWLPDSKLFKEVGLDALAARGAGTGPYKLVAWDATAVTYAAFDEAWRKPQIRNLRVVNVPDAATRVAGTISGEIDIAIGVPIDDVERIRAAGQQVHVIARPDVNALRLISVGRETPFKDVRVRQAVNHAVDRTAITRDLMKGLAEPGSQCGNKLNFGFNENVKPYAYDPAKAKQMLAQAGYPNGFEVAIDVIPDNFPADTASYQAVSQYLTAIGLKVTLNQITFAEWLRRWTPPAGSTTMGFPGDIFQNGCHNFTAHPLDSMVNLSCRRQPPSHCDAGELALIDQIEAEFDVTKQRALVQELMKQNHDNAAAIYLADIPDLTGLNKRVQGFENVMQRYSFSTMTLRP